MKLKIAVNKNCVDKTDANKATEGWKHHEVDLPWLQNWVTKGYGWCACWFVNRYRKEDNFCAKAGTNLVVLDIDGDTTLEAFWATNAAKNWCAATYTTTSHTDGEHRFRALFPLEKNLHSLTEHACAYQLIIDQLLPDLGLEKLSDNCGRKPERLWYGNKNAVFQFNENSEAAVPAWSLENIAAEEPSFEKTDATKEDIKKCQWLLRNFLRPSEDGEYEDYYLPVTAACASVGQEIFDDWVDWVLRGHHGEKPSNSKAFKWRGLNKSSALTLYKLAKEQDPNWYSKLPAEFKSQSLKRGKGYQEVDPLPIIKSEGTVDMANFTKMSISAVLPEPPQDVPVSDDAPATNKGRKSKTNSDKCAEQDEYVAAIQTAFKNIRMNILTDQVEYDGPDGKPEVIEGRRLDTMKTEMAIEHRVSIPKEEVISAIYYAARQNTHCPIKNYLETCERSSIPHPNWDNIASEFLHNDTPEANVALKRFMIGAVARAFNPGCAMSWLPILIGKQGAGKSMFCRSLAPTKLFAEVSTDIQGLIKEPAKLHQSWIIELPEIDYQFKVKNIEPFKNLVTTRIDETRKPYARESQKMPRRFVFMGTTNKSALLVDSTGNRRFVPIEIKPNHQVDWQRIQNERDMLWCSAVQAYRNQEIYEYTSGELENLSKYVKQFADPDPWEEIIINYLDEGHSQVSTTEILFGPLGFKDKTAQLSRRESTRVNSILEQNGWRRLKTSRKNLLTGKNETIRVWRNPNQLSEKEASRRGYLK